MLTPIRWRDPRPRRSMDVVSIDDVARPMGLVDGQPITEAEAEGWIPRTCFKHGPPRQIGIELEFLVHRERDHDRGDGDRHAQHLSTEQLHKLIEDLDDQPLHSKFTVEPGGQVELSSQPAEELSVLIPFIERDLALLSSTLARHGARLVGAGIDPLPPPPRHLRGPRYTAM